MWVLLYDESLGILAKKIWNKYGLVLRMGALDFKNETTYQNIFFHLRSKNTNIFETAIKSSIAAAEILQ
jgi:hypothetical protein